MKKPEPSLHLCNLASKYGLKKALEIIAEKSKPTAKVETKDGEPPKLSAAEKKAALVPEFDALGVETPPDGDSFAKWEQALAAAKEAAEKPADDAGDAGDLM